MYQEIEAGYSLLSTITSEPEEGDRSRIEGAIVQYFSETTTCHDKNRLWREIDFKKNLARSLNLEPKDIGMVKTILFSYLKQDQEKYVLVSTLAEKQIDYNEIRTELGLSSTEASTLNYKILDATLESIVGKKRGAVSPLVEAEYLPKIEAVYFTRDLMEDATSCIDKKYDVPRSTLVSEFWNAAVLFHSLQQQSPRYKTAGDFEPATVEVAAQNWRVKKIDPEKAGYQHLFGGTIVNYRGQEYQITNPPQKKEGVDRKRKKVMCTAFPISRTENQKIQYEYNEQGKKRVLLPITYELLEQLLPP